jgi:hypothetical protein
MDRSLSEKNILDMKISVLRNVTPCSLSDGYQNIAGIGWLRLQHGRPSPAYIRNISPRLASLYTLKMNAEDYLETLLTSHQSTQCHMWDDTILLIHRQDNFISRPVLVILQCIIKLSTDFHLTERPKMYCDSSNVGDIRNTWKLSLK